LQRKWQRQHDVIAGWRPNLDTNFIRQEDLVRKLYEV
jgi:hypothetical protein